MIFELLYKPLGYGFIYYPNPKNIEQKEVKHEPIQTIQMYSRKLLKHTLQYEQSKRRVFNMRGYNERRR